MGSHSWLGTSQCASPVRIWGQAPNVAS
jgi:hypothetical protein